jgi:deoxyribodipyrimidine photo-lyase
MIADTGAEGVYWNRGYEPHIVRRDTEIKSVLGEDGHDVKSFPGSVVREPWEVETGSGDPYKVYTPFWKAVLSKGIPGPAGHAKPELADLSGLGEKIDNLKLLPEKPDWAEGWQDLWSPGEKGAMQQLEQFLENGLEGYGELRNRPDLPNVSRLSPHLHFGEISPRQVCEIAYRKAGDQAKYSGDVKKFVAEIGWRDFANNLLFHFPEIPEKNWKPAFDAFPWRENEEDLQAWQKGQTGYPMIDAGMRELWQTGYMHNRVRMLVASFLVKHLRIHWKHGEEWFWDTLCDADMANNTTSWQWVTGSGADAAPYFRIFNPISQGPKFDPAGDYVRKWCPELAELDTKYIHAPFDAPDEALEKAGVELGKTYPNPLVDHAEAREAALKGYEDVKDAGN